MGDRRADALRWEVGDVTIDRVEARVVAVPHGSISTLITPELVDEHRPWIDPFVTDDGRIVLSRCPADALAGCSCGTVR